MNAHFIEVARLSSGPRLGISLGDLFRAQTWFWRENSTSYSRYDHRRCRVVPADEDASLTRMAVLRSCSPSQGIVGDQYVLGQTKRFSPALAGRNIGQHLGRRFQAFITAGRQSAPSAFKAGVLVGSGFDLLLQVVECASVPFPASLVFHARVGSCGHPRR